MTGWSGLPRKRLPFPSSTLISSEQQSGQSSAQTECRNSGILFDYSLQALCSKPALMGRVTINTAFLALLYRFWRRIEACFGCFLGYNQLGGHMRYLVGGLLIFGLAGIAFGQRGQSLGGFGSVLYPGGSPRPTPPGGVTGPYFFGAGAGRGAIPNPSVANHPGHRRSTIVPYPVYYGGYSYPYGYGYGSGYDPSAGYPPPAGYTDPSQTLTATACLRW